MHNLRIYYKYNTPHTRTQRGTLPTLQRKQKCFNPARSENKYRSKIELHLLICSRLSIVAVLLREKCDLQIFNTRNNFSVNSKEVFFSKLDNTALIYL